MDKQSINHNKLLAKVSKIFNDHGITSNPDNEIYYSRLNRDPETCHFILHGLTTYPIKIKTAYAESLNSNQAEGYVTKINRIKDEVIFIYDGGGWKKQSYLWALYDIGSAIGAEHVFNLASFEAWLISRLEEKKDR